MKQREIYLADLDPIVGHEQAGIRPVVIISGETMNDNLGLVMVCSLSSQLKQYHGSVLVKKSVSSGLTVDSEILPFQLRTISGQRLIRKLGEITPRELSRVIISVQQLLFL